MSEFKNEIKPLKNKDILEFCKFVDELIEIPHSIEIGKIDPEDLKKIQEASAMIDALIPPPPPIRISIKSWYPSWLVRLKVGWAIFWDKHWGKRWGDE